MAAIEPNAVVSHRIEVAPGLMVLRVVPDDWKQIDFTPGQFAVLGLTGSAPRCPGSDPDQQPAAANKMISRAYSIASSSVAREYLEFYITLVRSGALTPRLFNLKIGDRLWLGPKFSGFFTLESVPPQANIILVSTGTGLAPYISMVRTEVTHESRRRVAIIHGASHSWDLGYHAELITLQRASPMFTYIPIIGFPEQELVPWSGETGIVQDIWNRRMIDETWGLRVTPENTHIFLCGNPNMIREMEAIVQQEGFAEHKPRSPGQYHVERYW